MLERRCKGTSFPVRIRGLFTNGSLLFYFSLIREPNRSEAIPLKKPSVSDFSLAYAGDFAGWP
jgi:hypothetical protein